MQDGTSAAHAYAAARRGYWLTAASHGLVTWQSKSVWPAQRIWLTCGFARLSPSSHQWSGVTAVKDINMPEHGKAFKLGEWQTVACGRWKLAMTAWQPGILPLDQALHCHMGVGCVRVSSSAWGHLASRIRKGNARSFWYFCTRTACKKEFNKQTSGTAARLRY